MKRMTLAGLTLTLTMAATLAFGHGDLAPQPVNTDALPDVGEDWLIENPYRADKVGNEAWWQAVMTGDSGFNQNCARCHGPGAVSGGLAPDLRFPEAAEYGDEWFAERFQHGFTKNGTTKMPAFGEILGQKAGWAIRTYIETRPEDGALEAHKDRPGAIRDQLMAGEGDETALKAELLEIAAAVATASGAPKSDSAALRAALAQVGTLAAKRHAGEMLTVGLSAAH